LQKIRGMGSKGQQELMSGNGKIGRGLFRKRKNVTNLVILF